MSYREALIKLIKDLLYLLAGIAFFCIVAWVVTILPSEEKYMSDSMPADVGLGAVIFFLCIVPGFIYLIWWSVMMYVRRKKHRKTPYYWMNMILAWIPYLLILIPYVMAYIRYKNR